jgi:hypothetical protein
MAAIGGAMVAATNAAAAPKTIELKRDSRGNLIGATATVDDDE